MQKETFSEVVGEILETKDEKEWIRIIRQVEEECEESAHETPKIRRNGRLLSTPSVEQQSHDHEGKRQVGNKEELESGESCDDEERLHNRAICDSVLFPWGYSLWHYALTLSSARKMYVGVYSRPVHLSSSSMHLFIFLV